jgi:hypothetical protein
MQGVKGIRDINSLEARVVSMRLGCITTGKYHYNCLLILLSLRYIVSNMKNVRCSYLTMGISHLPIIYLSLCIINSYNTPNPLFFSFDAFSFISSLNHFDSFESNQRSLIVPRLLV